MNVNPCTIQVAALLVLVYALIGIGGCDSRTPAIGDSSADPMDALAAGTVSSEFDEAYWGEQRRNDTELWQRATTYCDGRDGNQFPNCRPVLSLLLLDRTLDRPATTSPGFDGSMDMTGRADSAQSRLDSLVSPQ
jgi:hypothetical protein